MKLQDYYQRENEPASTVVPSLGQAAQLSLGLNLLY